MGKTLRTAAQTAVIMALLTLGSKLFGFVREMVMANYFGTSFVTDAYVMSVAIPNIIFGGILSAVSVAYMPIFSQYIEQNSEKKGNEFTSAVLNILAITAVILWILGLIFTDQVIQIFASGFTGETAILTKHFLRITFFYLIFSSTADILDAFLRYKNVFIPQVAFGFIQNFILIGIIFVSAYTSYYYLVIGYLLVYVLRFIIMGFIAKKKSFRYSPNVELNNAVRYIIALALPIFIGTGVSQIGSFVDKTLASGLPEGSVSALNYGSLITALISGLTITIITTIIYPKMTQASAVNDIERLISIVVTGLNLIILIAVPCSLGAMVYSNQIVQVIYERGAFNSTGTSMTGIAFFYYMIGLTFSSLGILLTQAFYSRHDMKTPMIFGVIGVIIDIILNFILIKPLAHGGLALSTSIGAICVSTMLYFRLSKQYPEIKEKEVIIKWIKIIAAAVISVAVSYFSYQFIFDIYIGIRIFQLALAVGIAGLVYLLLIYFFRIEELDLLFGLIRRKK